MQIKGASSSWIVIVGNVLMPDKEILRPFFPKEYFLSFRLSLSTQGGVKKQRRRKLLFVLSFPFAIFNADYSKC